MTECSAVSDVTWLALVIVGVIASLSAALGLLLYRFSSAVVESRSIRLGGATAIAWLFFLALSKFFSTVSHDLQAQVGVQSKERRDNVRLASKEVTTRIREYSECALQMGDFQCKAPADQLRKACDALAAQSR